MSIDQKRMRINKSIGDYGMTLKSNILEKQKKAVEQMKELAIESGLFKAQQEEITEIGEENE